MVSSPGTVLIDKTITANDTYNAVDDNANGYSSVTVNVANSYTAGDEGKVVNNGALVSQTSTSATTNGIVDTTLNNSIDINVPNTYTVNDNGKVVNNQELVAQTAYPDTVTTNNTYDTTNYNSITVDVANTYTNEDEGKVVDNGELVAQTAYATEITENDTYDTTLYNSITVNVPSGGGSFTGSDVVFYDYDGSIVASYSAEDFATLTAMPTNPTHEGLTAQGWNWSLADAKSYVANYGKLNIGQMYITSDGKTRFYIMFNKDSLNINLVLYLHENTELDIDWGDGSTHSTLTSTYAKQTTEIHEYATTGDYVIAIAVIRGGWEYRYSSYNIKNVEIGAGLTSISDSVFSSCPLLSSITISNSVTSIGDSAFEQCSALSSITIPNSVTSIGNSAFNNCLALTSITIPNSVTSIDTGAFNTCSALLSITIPNSVTSIDAAFSNCYALTSTTIPNSVTSIGYGVFSNCFALTSITIPNSVTSIGSYVFGNCSALSSITIPNSVASIGDDAFSTCSALTSITFESSTPPAVDGYDLGLPYTCIIRVPQGSLEAYTTAENYPDPNAYTYEEY